MKKWVVLSMLLSFMAVGCISQENQNKLARKKVEYLEGDYDVTFSGYDFTKTWQVRNGKVTSRPMGYYFFWEDGKYVQTPIERTIVEEVKK